MELTWIIYVAIGLTALGIGVFVFLLFPGPRAAPARRMVRCIRRSAACRAPASRPRSSLRAPRLHRLAREAGDLRRSAGRVDGLGDRHLEDHPRGPSGP